MRTLIPAGVVAIGLAVLLLWRSPLIPRGAYRLGCLLGLVAFSAILYSRGSTWMIHIGRPPFAFLALLPILLFAITPCLLLLESGIAGYRGFLSWVRYVCVVLAAVGGVGLVASLLLPMWLRR